jgi:SAM-dependent methyltransferase
MTRARRIEDPVARARERAHRHGARALYREAALYDHLYRRRSADVNGYVELARRFGGPVLELGVGSGRVASAIARAGLEVTGVDTSKEMLSRAQQRVAALPAAVRARIRLRRGDLRALRLDLRFALVVAPFNAFTHLYTRRDFERALGCCRRQMRPGGRLAFDVVMPDLRALVQDPSRLYRAGFVVDPMNGERYAYSESSQYDAADQVRTVTMVMQREGGTVARAIPLSQRQFFPAELEALLHYNGFAIDARYGDFAFGPLTETSETQFVVARRARLS